PYRRSSDLARTGAGPGDGPGHGRAGPGRPEVERADGAVQPAGNGGGLRLDGNPDVRRRARTGALGAPAPGRRRAPASGPTVCDAPARIPVRLPTHPPLQGT